ncbi:agenet domain-containing protein [Striga asiatica]|uniref:Agenet domain-containing protein n=1 Tax=Striga asiatica TaxID=4170 RepID=A0A5A7NYE3_STRAF|nr:agenet domain-containing protein [Striga asiatica]
MENETYLTWEVGQLAEARSFEQGFRGAWFRCKITGVCETNGRIERVHLKYYDYVDDKPTWLKLYQVTSKKYKELMLRPCYPPIYNAKKRLHASAISEVSVIFDGSWKIELKPPPHGEGEVYVAKLKDVRPSLDWSPEYGWTMPKKEGDSGRPSAWLFKPKKPGAGEPKNPNTLSLGEETKVVSDDEMKSTETKDTNNISSQPKAPEKTKRTKKKREDYDDDSKTESGQAKTEPKPDGADKDNLDSGEDKKGKGELVLNSAHFDTLEAAVMDLEEYLNKVKWLKIVLEQGILPPDDKSQWQFVEPLVDNDATK